MSASNAIRAQILATLAAIASIGKVYDREKYAKQLGQLRAFYVGADDKIAGGFIRRTGRRKVSPDNGYTYVVYTQWEIHYFRSFLEDQDSEVDYDLMIDSIDEAFQADLTLSGVVDSTVTEDQAGIRLVSSQPAMFGDVLVHYAKMTLQTEHTESQ